MKNILSKVLQFTLFTAVGSAILYYVYYTQNAGWLEDKVQNPHGDSLLTKMLSDFGSVRLFWIFATMAAFTVSNLARALRWEMLLEPLGYKPRTRNTYLAIMAAYLANLAISRVGEVVRCTLVSRYEKIPVNVLFGTVVVDRALDVLCLLACVGLAFIMQFRKIYDFLTTNADITSKLSIFESPLFWALVVVGSVGLLLAYRYRARVAHLAIYEKIRSMILGFWDGIKTIGSLKNPALFVTYTIVIWGMYYLMTYLCFFSFAPTENLGLVAALTVFVFGSFGIVIPSPGGMGSFQFLTTAALVLYGVRGGDAFSFANIQFITVNLCIIFFGTLAFIAMPLMNRASK